MFNFIRKRMDKKGFTLVELLVVIAVLGIIAGIAIPRMTGVTDSFRKSADEKTAVNLIRQIQVNIQAGRITVPTGTDKQLVIMTEEPSTGAVAKAFYLGENIPNTQVDKAMFFVGEVTPTKVIIYRAASATAIVGTDVKITDADVEKKIE